MHRRIFVQLVACLFLAWQVLHAQDITLANKPDSVKFAAMGDNGTGDTPQYDIANLMSKVHDTFKFEFVIMLGDNMYGSQNPNDFERKFSTPYKTLLDGGVKFYAALGNHDNQKNVFFKPWNMGGERYYTFKKNNVRFFALDSDYIDPKQKEWLEKQLSSSNDDWKIVFFHHPLYSSAGRHGSEVDLRVLLEPIFVKYGVNVVFSGHDHVYERIKPQQGIYYFLSGAAGQLRRGDLQKSDLTAAGYDQDRSFMLIEIDKDDFLFEAISRTGKAVDSGSFKRQKKDAAQSTQSKQSPQSSPR